MAINENDYEEMYENVRLNALASIWFLLSSENYEEKIDEFLEWLDYFIRTDKLKLAKKGVFLEGTIEEQLDLFKKSFPKEEVMKEIEHYWWFLDECPAGGVWIVDFELEGFTTPAENGKYYWWG